jgi:hypothetical protein
MIYLATSIPHIYSSVPISICKQALFLLIAMAPNKPHVDLLESQNSLSMSFLVQCANGDLITASFIGIYLAIKACSSGVGVDFTRKFPSIVELLMYQEMLFP